MAVIVRKQPECIPDLPGYQNLIIKAHLQFEGDSWMGYNRCFGQNAATGSSTIWARIDNTLWNLDFSSKAKGSCCRHYFRLTHPSTSRDLAPVEQSHTVSRAPYMSELSIHGMEQYSFSLLLFTPCKYENVHLLCVASLAVSNKNYQGYKLSKCPASTQ